MRSAGVADWRVGRRDEPRQRGVEMLPLQEGHQRLARSVRVPRADADRPEQMPVAGMSDEELADPAPEQQQRAVVLLIFLADEGPPEFEHGSPDLPQQTRVVAKERTRVKAADAVTCDDRVRLAHSIRADDLSRIAIPHEEMQIVRVEPIEIDRATGALADGAKRP